MVMRVRSRGKPLAFRLTARMSPARASVTPLLMPETIQRDMPNQCRRTMTAAFIVGPIFDR